MDFTLDETQQAIADLTAGVLRGEADDNRTRAALASPAGYDETAWKALAQAGLLGLAVPEQAGGDGQGPIEVGLVLSEVGRQTLPLPALATLGLAVAPLASIGQAGLLAEVADGRVLTAAVRPAPGTPARLDSRLTGAFVGVPYAAQAHRVLVPVGDVTAVLDPRADGVTLTRTPSSSGAPEYTLRADAATVDARLDLPAGVLDHYAVAAAAAVADGVLAGALDLTARHLRERQQFGRRLAEFQAVAQQIADVYVVARTVHLTAVSCAWRLANGREVDEDVAVAAYWVSAKVPAALQVCHHLHGGLGADITYPLHRYYAAGKDLARLLGGAAARLDTLGNRCSSS